MSLKLCVNCSWYSYDYPGTYYAQCNCPADDFYEPVAGNRLQMPCYEARGDERFCGREGRHFFPKETP